RVATVIPMPFSKRLTVLAAIPAFLPRSRTPQPSAALAIRTCLRVIMLRRRLTVYTDPCTLCPIEIQPLLRNAPAEPEPARPLLPTPQDTYDAHLPRCRR